MMNKNDIEQIIPHRDPFLLVDRITELEVGIRAKGIKYVREDEYYFEGHFPDNPVMPGVIILETMAQVGAVATLAAEEQQNKTAYLVSVDNAKFRQVVRPGDKLILECELTSFRRGIGFAKCEAFVDGELVCEARIGFAVK